MPPNAPSATTKKAIRKIWKDLLTDANIRLALMVIGIGLGLLVSRLFTLTVFALWVLGCIYNIPPIRSKDVPYIDVLLEAVNNRCACSPAGS